jgi:hypothetical protein
MLFPTSTKDEELHINFESTCLTCGEVVREICYNKKTGTATFSVFKKNNEGKYNYSPLDYCKYSELESIDETITVDSNLVFRNFFLTQDNDYFKKTDSSISQIKGIKKLADLYAEENILYGQTGNMSIYIYQKDDNLVLLNSDIHSDFEDYDLSDIESEQIHFYKDWDYKGSISCEVWRYMASSRSNLEKLNLKEDPYDSEVEVSLTSGKYTMKHNYGIKYHGFLVSKITKDI